MRRIVDPTLSIARHAIAIWRPCGYIVRLSANTRRPIIGETPARTGSGLGDNLRHARICRQRLSDPG
jgi:hypothetical protein